jgi:hypothetical protein
MASLVEMVREIIRKIKVLKMVLFWKMWIPW